jgi:hypothetical protein
MVAKLMDYNYNILTFIHALPLDVHVKVGHKVIGVDYDSYIVIKCQGGKY